MMILVEQDAVCILELSKKIFEMNEEKNPQTIFKDKIFLIQHEGISVERGDCKDSSYYFDHPGTHGVIIRKENGNYFIKALVRYINSKGEKRAFAKIRIYDDFGTIQIRGRRTGSWQMQDSDDDDFIKNPDDELALVLDSLKNSLWNMRDELNKNPDLGRDQYIPRHQKRLIPYNV